MAFFRKNRKKEENNVTDSAAKNANEVPGKDEERSSNNDGKAGTNEVGTDEDLSDSERLQAGQLLCRFIVEILGKPKEYVDETIKDYVSHIKKNKAYMVIKEDYSGAEEKGELFSEFVELEVWVKDVNSLLAFCFDYMPSSVEVLEPETLAYHCADFAGFLNDLQARLHEMDMLVKLNKQEKINLQNNSERLIKNLVILATKDSPKSLEELSKVVGIEAKHLKVFLEGFIKEGKIKNQDGMYSVTKGL